MTCSLTVDLKSLNTRAQKYCMLSLTGVGHILHTNMQHHRGAPVELWLSLRHSPAASFNSTTLVASNIMSTLPNAVARDMDIPPFLAPGLPVDGNLVQLFEFRCDGKIGPAGERCPASFLTQYELTRHQDTDHNRRREFKCSTCISVVYMQLDSLHRHYRVCHPDLELPGDSSLSGSPNAVRAPSGRPHVCSTCRRCFARLEHLKRHERSHTTEKPFTCAECPRCFARRDLLLRHSQRVHKPSNGQDSRGPSHRLSESLIPSSVSSDSVMERYRQPTTGPPEGLVCQFPGCFANDRPFEDAISIAMHEFECHRDEHTFMTTNRYEGSNDLGHREDSFAYANRPSSRNSAGSIGSRGSCDSGISHPPRLGREKRKKKVVEMPFSEMDRWRHQQLDIEMLERLDSYKSQRDSILRLSLSAALER